MENSDGEVERVLATLKSLPKPIPSRRCAACMFQNVSTSCSASCNVAAIGYFLANVSESPFRALQCETSDGAGICPPDFILRADGWQKIW